MIDTPVSSASYARIVTLDGNTVIRVNRYGYILLLLDRQRKHFAPGDVRYSEYGPIT